MTKQNSEFNNLTEQVAAINSTSPSVEPSPTSEIMNSCSNFASLPSASTGEPTNELSSSTNAENSPVLTQNDNVVSDSSDTEGQNDEIVSSDNPDNNAAPFINDYFSYLIPKEAEDVWQPLSSVVRKAFKIALNMEDDSERTNRSEQPGDLRNSAGNNIYEDLKNNGSIAEADDEF